MNTQEETIEILEEVRSILTAYLESRNLRRTEERFAILNEIYKLKEHFDAESLFLHMKKLNYQVSRATVYNNLDLLVQCALVKKHQFGKNMAQYERSYGNKQHDHLICLDCARVIEFCDPRIQQIKDMMGEMLHFKVAHHSLNLYGHCTGACQKEKQV